MLLPCPPAGPFGRRLIALTGCALPDDLKRSAEAGFEGHLAKPLRLEELSALPG